MFSITVSVDSLKALTLIAAKDDVRYYLRSVCVDLTAAGRVHLVSCDGHRALIVGNATLEGERQDGTYLVPIEALAGIKPYAKGGPIVIEIEPDAAGTCGTYTVRGRLTTTGKLVDGRYPDWRRIVPDKCSGELAHFNFTYLGDFGRVADLLGCKYPFVFHNGNAGARLYLGEHAFAVLMPIRSDTFKGLPFVDWLEAVPQTVRKAA